MVEKFIGDAVMAVFGLHRSREDDAARAVRAALAMVASLRERGRRRRAPLRRAAADAGRPRHRRRGGQHPRGAARARLRRGRADGQPGQPAAGRGARRTWCSSARTPTARSAAGSASSPRPGLRLKGIDEPVDAYVVLAERPRGFQLERAARRRRAWRPARSAATSSCWPCRSTSPTSSRSRRWRVTTVVGDAGVGKSRLLARAATPGSQERPDPVWWFRGRASPSGQNRPHALLRDVVTTRFGIAASDSPATVARALRGRLRRRLRPVGPHPPRRRGGRRGGSGSRSPTTGEQRAPRPAGVCATRRATCSPATSSSWRRTAPVVVLLEDLHWADDASLAWLDAADGVLPRRPVLVVATARPTLLEARPHWGEGLAHHARLDAGAAVAPGEPAAARASCSSTSARSRRELVDLVVDARRGQPLLHRGARHLARRRRRRRARRRGLGRAARAGSTTCRCRPR